MTTKSERSSEGWVGLCAMALILVGASALVMGFVGVFTEEGTTGPGLCFLASAVAFGSMLNAMMR